MADADASHCVGPGATEQGESVVVGVGVVVGVVVGTAVVLASVVDGLVVTVGGLEVGEVGAPVQVGTG